MVSSSPANEAARLEALRSYGILDTPPEQEYEDLVALAAEICGTPLASITLVDEARQWFKAQRGFDVSETPRRLSFCSQVIAIPGDELFVVTDASRDPRFAQYDNVTGPPGIRFYAGAPLVTPEGFALGTLCVIDRQPRELTAAQERALRVLRRHVITALELRRLIHQQKVNIATLRDTQQKLEQSRAAAVAAAEAKSRFLATMSHEIRTPMNAVVASADLLARSPLPTPQQEIVETIRVSSQLLLRLVNDVLDLAKIESGRLELEEAPFSLASCLDHAVRLVRTAAEAKGLKLEAQLAPGIPNHIVGDETRLTQILVNLLSNAVKFTSAGRIDVRVTAQPRPGSNEVELSFAVTDTGIGLSAEQIGRLFEEFSQADASTTRRFGGTGLGLAISQRLAQLQRGRIRVDSTPGQGSTFTLTIVARAADGAAPAAPAAPPRTLDATFAQRFSAKVLVADDNPVNLQIVQRQLGRLGYTAETATNGAEALAQWRVRAHDLVLLDVEMPEMDGLQAAAAIRQEGAAQPVCILMLTAHASEEARTPCPAAGANERLAKPITLGDLAQAIEQHLTRKA